MHLPVSGYINMLSIANIEILFRIGTSISLTGISFLLFIIPSIVKNKSMSLFSYLHSFTCGILLAMSLVVLFIESTQPPGLHASISLMIMSSFFILMTILQYAQAQDAYDYKPLHDLEETLGDNSTGEDELELTEDQNMVASDDENGVMNGVTTTGNSIKNSHNHINNTTLGDRALSVVQSMRLMPYTVLFFVSMYDLFSGIPIGYQVHNGYGPLIKILLYKALLALTFGTILERLNAPSTLQLLFMCVFTLSSALGILSGEILYLVFGFDIENQVMIINNLSLLLASMTAGIFLHVVTMSMIPADINTPRNDNSYEHNTDQEWKKIIKVCMILLGYFITVLPSYMFDSSKS